LNKLFLLLLLAISIISSDEIQIGNVKISDIQYSPYKEEGYLQGWNFVFQNSEHTIFANFIVSNLGPFDLNHGVSLIIQSRNQKTIFLTKEFGKKDLEISKDGFKIRSYNNILEHENGVYKISQFFGNIKLYLEFKSDSKGATLSAGKHYVKGNDKFVKADIPFSFVPTKGYLDLKGEIIDLEGLGGMEHLLTNYEVYKFSSKWEILRATNGKGFRFYSGGFHGINKIENDFFRTIAIQNNKGENILSGRVIKSEIIKSSKDLFSKHIIPEIEKLYLTDSCSITLEMKDSLGKVNILSNISAVLTFFVKLFFTNPFQLNFESQIKVDCPNEFKKGIEDFKGIHTLFLINPK
jgi:hypothetical protein